MKKKITIIFWTSADMRRTLETIARTDESSLSSTVEHIVADYMKSTSFQNRVRPEKRRHPRKVVSIPAYVKTRDSDANHEAVVLDLSLGGICVTVPKECILRIDESDENSQFETSFAVPGNKPVRIICKAERVVPRNGNPHVGASFIDADFAIYQNLQQYLMEKRPERRGPGHEAPDRKRIGRSLYTTIVKVTG